MHKRRASQKRGSGEVRREKKEGRLKEQSTTSKNNLLPIAVSSPWSKVTLFFVIDHSTHKFDSRWRRGGREGVHAGRHVGHRKAEPSVDTAFGAHDAKTHHRAPRVHSFDAVFACGDHGLRSHDVIEHARWSSRLHFAIQCHVGEALGAQHEAQLRSRVFGSERGVLPDAELCERRRVLGERLEEPIHTNPPGPFKRIRCFTRRAKRLPNHGTQGRYKWHKSNARLLFHPHSNSGSSPNECEHHFDLTL